MHQDRERHPGGKYASGLGALEKEGSHMALDVATVEVRPRTRSLLVAGAAILALLVSMSLTAVEATAQSEPDCTMVMGFSQTADWYMAPVRRSTNPDQPPQAAQIFESRVDSDRWELKWQGGAGVNIWSDPNHSAWDAPILFPCEAGSGQPDRIVFMISGPFGTDEEAWANEINIALDNIRDHFPSAQAIVLQPVVGAPEGLDECFHDGTRVRASWQAKHIVNAIEVVAPQHDDVVVGALTRVKSCDHYSDSLGHIDGGGAAAAGADTGQFYSDFDW